MMAQATSENPPFQRILIYNNSRFSRSVERLGLSGRAELEANGIRNNLHRGTCRQQPNIRTKRTTTPWKHGPGGYRALSYFRWTPQASRLQRWPRRQRRHLPQAVSKDPGRLRLPGKKYLSSPPRGKIHHRVQQADHLSEETRIGRHRSLDVIQPLRNTPQDIRVRPQKEGVQRQQPRDQPGLDLTAKRHPKYIAFQVRPIPRPLHR